MEHGNDWGIMPRPEDGTHGEKQVPLTILSSDLKAATDGTFLEPFLTKFTQGTAELNLACNLQANRRDPETDWDFAQVEIDVQIPDSTKHITLTLAAGTESVRISFIDYELPGVPPPRKEIATGQDVAIEFMGIARRIFLPNPPEEIAAPSPNQP